MSGVAMQRLLIDEEHDMPIIFITAFLEAAIRGQALEAGAIAFLNKPFDEKTLIKCLGAALKMPDDGRAGCN